MNISKHIALLLTLFLSINSYSQKTQNTKTNRVKAYKIAYMTDELNLTEKEAEKFWPIYNAHEQLISKLRTKEMKTIKSSGLDIYKPQEINESDAEKIVNSVMELRQKTYLENQVYFKKLKKFLPYTKILKLQIAEKEFRKTLFENLRKRRKRGFEKKN